MNNFNSTMAPTLPASPSTAYGYVDLPTLMPDAIISDTAPSTSVPEVEVEVDIEAFPAPVVTENLMHEKAMLVHLSISQIGRTRQVREGELEIAQEGEDGLGLKAANTDKNLVKVTKTLFQCAELKRIEKLDSEVRAFISRKCLPSPLRGKSVYLLPLANVELVNAKLHAFEAERDVLVAAFVAKYPRLLVQARRQLRDLFDRHDYPGRDQVAGCFGLHWQLLAIGVPDALAEISTEIFEQERAKSAAQWASAQEEIQTLLRVRLKSMVQNLVERLKPAADGQKKVFRNTLVSNLDDFIKDFSALNITNDKELEKVVSDVRDLMSGVDAQLLRDSGKARDLITSGAAQIESELSTLIVDKPKRLIRFADE